MEPASVNNNQCKICHAKLLTESSKQAMKCSDCRIGNSRVNLKNWNLPEGRFETIRTGKYEINKDDSINAYNIKDAYPFSFKSGEKDEGEGNAI